MQLIIDRAGTIRCLYGEALDLAALGRPVIARASHVDPGPDGRWSADLRPLRGPVLGPFPLRSAALEAEQAWLEAHWLSPAPGSVRPGGPGGEGGQPPPCPLSGSGRATRAVIRDPSSFLIPPSGQGHRGRPARRSRLVTFPDQEATIMTETQLVGAVADVTGESPRTIRRLGFSPCDVRGADLAPEDLALVLDCPFCGRAVPDPGRVRGGVAPLAECDHCDVYFEFAPGEVYAAARSA